MMDLPQELIDAILGDVVGNENLEACALTARVFLAPSQRRLFRRMCLRWDSSSRVASAFPRALSFLQENPHLALYFRDLTFDLPKSHADQSTLEAVLRMLGNLERVAINGYGQEWDELLGSLTSAILTTISLPSLLRFHLRRLASVPHTPRGLLRARLVPQSDRSAASWEYPRLYPAKYTPRASHSSLVPDDSDVAPGLRVSPRRAEPSTTFSECNGDDLL
ncbi:hypothetical protein C8F04DRAFT_1266034 [Mycena alexandri]|uniref:Uncharacterized protein n=1 Tax=Mycena alexandri TaxID=1745969 RepID=A0AAD6SK50_9AGAR|nr:hypothetical protein C8F04DRAFT_1266034 [Mycena alexandri]